MDSDNDLSEDSFLSNDEKAEQRKATLEAFSNMRVMMRQKRKQKMKMMNIFNNEDGTVDNEVNPTQVKVVMSNLKNSEEDLKLVDVSEENKEKLGKSMKFKNEEEEPLGRIGNERGTSSQPKMKKAVGKMSSGNLRNSGANKSRNKLKNGRGRRRR